ncbi:MAG: D-glycero-beta-D-manno-heptose 1-phosphate adenylyltransferase [Phycisphaerales bacterium]
MPTNPKLIDLDRLRPRLDRRRARGHRIVMTNGCFDVLHAGHVRYLRSARRLGDLLVVGLNGDASVRRLKGDGRPVYSLDDRAEILAAFPFVTFIVPFDTDSVESLVRSIRPDVLVKGGDYTPEEVVGGDFVRAQGGRVVVLDHLEGRSTTETLHRQRGS